MLKDIIESGLEKCFTNLFQDQTEQIWDGVQLAMPFMYE